MTTIRHYVVSRGQAWWVENFDDDDTAKWVLMIGYLDEGAIQAPIRADQVTQWHDTGWQHFSGVGGLRDATLVIGNTIRLMAGCAVLPYQLVMHQHKGEDNV